MSLPDRAPSDRSVFAMDFTPMATDIDELGHVNNVVYLRWIQEIATAHWTRVADPAHLDAYLWVVARHEIDYLRAVMPGETVHALTWVGDAPRGARFDRHIEFAGSDGKPRVIAKTTWAIIDRASMRAMRVPIEVAAPFLRAERLHSAHGGG